MSAAQVIEIQGVVVERRIVVEWGGRFSDRPYCGALASSGYLAAGASGGERGQDLGQARPVGRAGQL